MSFFDDLLLNIIFILFPILLYYMFNVNLNKRLKSIITEIVPIVMIYLILRYTYSFSVNTYFLFLNIPFLFSLSNNKKISPIIIVIILVYLNITIYNFNWFWLSLEYIFYLILFELITNKKIVSYQTSLNYFIIIKGTILTIEAIYLKPSLENNGIIITKLFIILIVFYFISIFVFIIIRKCYETISLRNALTELKKEKEIKASLFKITHEVKNPLAVCKGYLQMMNYNNIEKVKQYNKIIKKEINRTLDIMNNFSEYTKIKVELKKINIKTLIEDTKISIITLLNDNKINLELNNIKDIIINGDYERLKQVLINIIKNSTEAIKEDGKIQITLKENKKTIDIIVEDNGEGIKEDDLKHIYEMFYTTKKDGSGIGIPLCNEIIKLHNGKLNYYSKENIGTKVVINLPKSLQ